MERFETSLPGKAGSDGLVSLVFEQAARMVRGAALGLAVASLLGAGTMGCKSTGGIEPPQAYVAPDWADQKIQSVAFVGLAGATIDENDRRMAEEIVEQELRSSQTRFLVLAKNAALDRAQKAGVKADFERVAQVWKGSHTVDELVARRVCEKLGVDGLMVATLDEWKKEKADWQTEEASFSEVGVELAIVGAKSGLIAWQASKRIRENSAVYQPGQSATGFYQSDPNGTQRQAQASSAVPEPPDIDAVARKVMGSLMSAFPEATP